MFPGEQENKKAAVGLKVDCELNLIADIFTAAFIEAPLGLYRCGSWFANIGSSVGFYLLTETKIKKQTVEREINLYLLQPLCSSLHMEL